MKKIAYITIVIPILLLSLIGCGSRNELNSVKTQQDETTYDFLNESSNENLIEVAEEIEEQDTESFGKILADIESCIDLSDEAIDSDYMLLCTYANPRLSEDGIGLDRFTMFSDDEQYHINNIYDILDHKYDEELLDTATIQIGNDNKRIMIGFTDESERTYDIIDLEERQIIESITYNIYEFQINFLPSLEKYILFNRQEDTMELMEVNNSGQEKSLDIDYFSAQSHIVSQDERFIMYISENCNDKCLEIFDMEKNELFKSIVLDSNDHIRLSQCFGEKILFNQGTSAYILDIETEEIVLIGKYISNPIISPDGRYLAYSIVENFANLDMAGYLEEDLYRQYMTYKGVYIYDIANKETTRISDEITPDFFAVQWFEKGILHEDLQRDYPMIFERSSALTDENNFDKYSVYNIVNNITTDAWAEGVEGDGIGEWVQINFQVTDRYSLSDRILISKPVYRIDIINGYGLSTDLYYANNRVKKVTVQFSDGTTVVKEFEDNNLDFQSIVLDVPVQTEYVKIIIDDVYQGNAFQDTCISEVKIY